MDRRHAVPKLIFSVLCAVCAVAIAVTPPRFNIESSGFKSGAPIPVEFTCDGADASPPLAWSGKPKDPAALALVVDDPDAPSGLFTHWLLWNLPATADSLPRAGAVD